MIEIELKFKINNIEKLLKKLKGVKPQVFYVKDEIFGKKNINFKIRKRTTFNYNNSNIVEIGFEKTTPLDSKKIKKIIEEKIIKIPNDFKCENSYDKIRFLYKRFQCEIMIDFYPIGIFCEIEGNEKKIKMVAQKMGFKLKDNLKENIDKIYCNLTKKNKNKVLNHWGFNNYEKFN